MKLNNDHENTEYSRSPLWGLGYGRQRKQVVCRNSFMPSHKEQGDRGCYSYCTDLKKSEAWRRVVGGKQLVQDPTPVSDKA